MLTLKTSHTENTTSSTFTGIRASGPVNSNAGLSQLSHNLDEIAMMDRVITGSINTVPGVYVAFQFVPSFLA